MEYPKLKFIVAAFLLLHLLLSALYIFRDSIPSGIAKWAVGYCKPLFHQNWMLFAPDVAEYDVQLQYRLHGDQWLDIVVNTTGSSPLERAERHLANALTWDYVSLVFSEAESLNFDSFVKSRSYQMANKWTCNFLRKYENQNIDSLQLRLYYKFYDIKNAYGMARLDSLVMPSCGCKMYSSGNDLAATWK